MKTSNSLKNHGLLAVVTCLFLLLSGSVLAAGNNVVIGGELLVDLNINRGLNLRLNPVGGANNGAYYWTNYGTAGGVFQSLRNPPFLTLRTNPFTYQVVGGSNALFTAGGQGMESTFTCPDEITGRTCGVGNPYTVEVWYWPNRDRGTDYDRVVCWGADTGNAGTGSGASIGYGSIGGLGYGDKHGGLDLTWSPFSPIQNWYHIVETYDGATAIFYVNGVEKSRVTGNLNIQPGRRILLGTGNQPNVNYDNTVLSANGGFSATRMHTQPLSPAAVSNNFAVGPEVLPVMEIAVRSLPASGIGVTGATLNGDLKVTTAPASTQLTFYWGTIDRGNTTVGWDHSVTLAAPHAVGTFSTAVSGLIGGVDYYYRIRATNINGDAWSKAACFKGFVPPVRLIDIRSSFLGADGPLTSWTNNGTLGGSFVTSGPANKPVTTGTNGGIKSAGFINSGAFDSGSSMQLKNGSGNFITLAATNTGLNPWTVSVWAYKYSNGVSGAPHGILSWYPQNDGQTPKLSPSLGLMWGGYDGPTEDSAVRISGLAPGLKFFWDITKPYGDPVTNTGTWHNLTWTYDGVTLAVYWDGALNTSKPWASTTPPGGEITLGAFGWDGSLLGNTIYASLNGAIGSLVWQSGALADAAAVTDLMNEINPATIIPFRVTQVRYDGLNDQIILTWNSTPGATYTIENAQQFIGNGSGTSWDNLTTGIPSGGSTTTRVIDAPQPGTYYRIRKE